MPLVLAVIEGNDWYCCYCRPIRMVGPIRDAMRHLVEVHDVHQWTIDSEAGVVFDGILEMATADQWGMRSET